MEFLWIINFWSLHIWQECLIHIQEQAAAPAEKADFNAWYILMACFPSSSSSL